MHSGGRSVDQAPGHLDGTVALVTGASSGIGEATAVALADAGATVALIARRRDRLDEMKERIIASDAVPPAVTLTPTSPTRNQAETEPCNGSLPGWADSTSSSTTPA